MQAPHPVQASASTRIAPMGRWVRSKRNARVSQASVQERHSIPPFMRHSGVRLADRAQGARVRSKTGSGQETAQSWQKVQAPTLKSTMGVPAGPRIRIASGHARMQSPQDVQALRMRASVLHGGRRPSLRPRSDLIGRYCLKGRIFEMCSRFSLAPFSRSLACSGDASHRGRACP